jgi:hypothetical protein
MRDGRSPSRRQLRDPDTRTSRTRSRFTVGHAMRSRSRGLPDEALVPAPRTVTNSDPSRIPKNSQTHLEVPGTSSTSRCFWPLFVASRRSSRRDCAAVLDGLKVVRPRLRLRALHLDPVCAPQGLGDQRRRRSCSHLLLRVTGPGSPTNFAPTSDSRSHLARVAVPCWACWFHRH